MSTTTLKTRIILNNKTASEWASNSTFVGLKGEFLIESDTRKLKIGDGATVYSDLPYINVTPEEIKTITGQSHTHNNKAILDATTASFTTDLLSKLDGIESGATKTIVDSALSSSSTNPVQNKVVNSALAGKVPTSRTVNGKSLSSNITLSAGDVGAIATTAKGAASGVAELDSSGKVPSSQLPSYVDDVLEGYYGDATSFYKDSGKTTLYTGETGKIYVDLSTNKTYRWSGSAYVVVSETLALGETSSTAYRGDRGKIAYDHSQTAHAPSNAERNIIVGVQKNGTDLTIDSSTRKVNITVPTKTSELTNDSGYQTSSGTVSKANQLTTARAIDGVNFNGTAAITHYGACSTAAATAAKTVSLSNFTLTTGSRIIVKFTATNTASSPTLNVNGTGAKAIYYKGSAITASYLAANKVYEFVYDGTNYNLIGDVDTNTIYSAGTGLTLSGTQFKISNTITAGTVKGDNSKTLAFGGTFVIPSITYDSNGLITSTTTTTMTMPATPTTITGNAGSATKLATARNFSITGGATAAAVSFNGTADVSLNVTALNAAKLYINSSDTLVLDGSI